MTTSITTTKTCRTCGVSLPTSDFWSNKQSRDGLHPHCRACARRRWDKYRAKQDRPAIYLKARYGITPERLEEMRREAAGRCAICRRESRLVIDHNHSTGVVRGLLCHGCNIMLGFLESRDHLLEAAQAYLDGCPHGQALDN